MAIRAFCDFLHKVKHHIFPPRHTNLPGHQTKVIRSGYDSLQNTVLL